MFGHDSCFGISMIAEKRSLAIVAPAFGLVSAVLILLGATRGGSVDFLALVIGLGVLYGSHLISRGKESPLFGWAKARSGALINLILGIVALIGPGGVGGTAAIPAILRGVLGFWSRKRFKSR